MTDYTKPEPDKLSKVNKPVVKDALKDAIGSNLKQLYDDVVNEEVPSDFLDLLAKADQVQN